MAVRDKSLSCFPIRAIFLMVVLFNVTEGGRLLVFPQDGSHWLSMQSLVEKLSHKGHQIVVVIPENNLFIKGLANYTVRSFSTPYGKDFLEDHMKSMSKEVFKDNPFLQRMMHMRRRISKMTGSLLEACKNLLNNATLIKDLEQRNFHAVLNDPVLPCGEIVAEHLSIPSVFFMRGALFGIDQEACLSPSPPSYVPRIFTTYSDHMTFSQRVKNLLVYLTEHVLGRMFYSSYASLATDFLKREVTPIDLFSRASIWLLRYDFTFEYPKPVMPNMIFIGGINCVNRKPLTEEFEKIVNGSGEHGFVVFSMGSMVSEIPMNNAMDLAEALGGIPQTVLWRYTGTPPSNLPENVHLVKWLPQNDLLAHPKARAFISHAGSHGIYEGICNAVPMVMLPLFGDQMDNAKRIESRGAGITINVLNLIPDDLTKALNEVILNPSYKENVQRLSSLHLDRPIEPLDLAVHWVEFVMRHKGAPHLRPAAHDLNWIQYHSLDVIGFLLAVLLTTLFITLKFCAFCCRCCCRVGSRKKSKPKSE